MFENHPTPWRLERDFPIEVLHRDGPAWIEPKAKLALLDANSNCIFVSDEWRSDCFESSGLSHPEEAIPTRVLQLIWDLYEASAGSFCFPMTAEVRR